MCLTELCARCAKSGPIDSVKIRDWSQNFFSNSYFFFWNWRFFCILNASILLVLSLFFYSSRLSVMSLSNYAKMVWSEEIICSAFNSSGTVPLSNGFASCLITSSPLGAALLMILRNSSRVTISFLWLLMWSRSRIMTRSSFSWTADQILVASWPHFAMLTIRFS